MNQDELNRIIDDAAANAPHPKRHDLKPFRDSSRTRTLRMWLNIIFMVGAVIGLIVYFTDSHDSGAYQYILIAACVFKFVELGLRILKV